jgi:hypothetical protein
VADVRAFEAMGGYGPVTPEAARLLGEQVERLTSLTNALIDRAR